MQLYLDVLARELEGVLIANESSLARRRIVASVAECEKEVPRAGEVLLPYEKIDIGKSAKRGIAIGGDRNRRPLENDQVDPEI